MADTDSTDNDAQIVNLDDVRPAPRRTERWWRGFKIITEYDPEQRKWNWSVKYHVPRARHGTASTERDARRKAERMCRSIEDSGGGPE